MSEGQPKNYTASFEKEIGIFDLSSVLAKQRMSELSSILIKSFRERSEALKPDEVLKEYKNKNEFYGPSDLDQRSIHDFNSNFFSVLPEDFFALELSPISPLGLNSTVTNLSQDLTLATIRGSEVVGDPTSALAIEAAKKRRQDVVGLENRDRSVKLATCSRVLRMQPFDKNKGYMQHFSIFGLCSAGRDKAGSLFLEDAIFDHISVWLDMVSKLNLEKGELFKDIEVKISDVRIIEQIISSLNLPRDVINRNSLNEDWDMFKENSVDFPEESDSVVDIPSDLISKFDLKNILFKMSQVENKVLPLLKERFPNIKFTFDFNRKAGLGYYQDVCFHIFAKNSQDRIVQLSDGGTVDWVAKFLTSDKERAFTSGFGSELIQKLFLK